MSKSRANVKKLNAAYVSGTVGDGVTNDTAAIQAAIDAATDGQTLIFPKAAYAFTRLSLTKSLTLDFNGSTLNINPAEGSLTLARGAAINFTGSRGIYYNFNTAAVLGNTITMTTPAEAGNFAEGDYVFLKDVKYMPAWDDLGGTGTGSATSMISTGSTGRSEPNMVQSVDAVTGVVTLKKPIEFLYDTTPQIAKLTPLFNPAVRNIGLVTEVDPGGVYTGASGAGPHLVTFAYSVSPRAENITADGFQLHVVQFNFCWTPEVTRVRAEHPFRPASGGHGYLMQFNNCVGGVAHHNFAIGLRHTVDFTMSFDCTSHDNITTGNSSTAYFCHGLSSNRCASVDDVCHSFDAGGVGWQAGNPSFKADFNYKIIRPRFYGVYGPAVGSFGYSENTEVIDPLFIIKKPVSSTGAARGVYAYGGAINTIVRGGVVDFSGCLGSASDAPISTSGKVNTSETYIVPPTDLRVEGTRFIMPNAAIAGITLNEANGTAILSPRVVGGGTTSIGVRVTSAATLTNLILEDGEYSGSFARGIYIQAAPSGIYSVLRNSSQGTYSTGFYSIAVIAAALVLTPVPGVLLPGNAAAALTAGNSAESVVYASPITANRAVSLSTTQVWTGAKFRITRTAAATGAFTVDVGTGPLKSLAAGQWCEVTYTGAAWVLSQFGSL